jgi:hypothetical protein
MAQKKRRGMSAVETAELWARCKAGESFTAIGRAVGRHVGSVYAVIRAQGGIAPAARRSATSRTASALNSAVYARRSRRPAFVFDRMCHLRPHLRASWASTKWGQLQSSLMGLILLVLLVVKNGIILLDFTRHVMILEGLALSEALHVAGRVRLRPILMTTLCQLFGLLPLALGIGAGSELQRPLALAVIGGLALSTPITLFVVPTLLVALRGRGYSLPRPSGVIRQGRSREAANSPVHEV